MTNKGKGMLVFTVVYVLLVFFVLTVGCMSKKEVKEENDVYEIIVDGSTARNSLDYWGTYEGITPCADCEGIETTILLDQVGFYTRTMKYLGKGDDNVFIETGEYYWEDDEFTIKLETDDTPSYIWVSENSITLLDGDKNKITGNLADFYVLRKVKQE
ncbi:MAG: copper resistance protein NlpE [Candidatus Caldatribacteriota bacterium]